MYMADLKSLAERLIPEKPSGFNGHCRSALSMANDAGNVGQSALVPPVAGAVSAVIGAANAAGQNLADGDIGAAAGALASGIPAAVAGFFGGGVAADAVQGVTNTIIKQTGINRGNLPGSSLENLAQDATCNNAPEVPSAADKPTSLTEGLKLPEGTKPRTITPAERAKAARLTMPPLY
ncbi:MAG: hypothetical protein AB7H77_00320 [Bdellovibrionales bacterium]